MLQTQYIYKKRTFFNHANLINAKQHQLEAIKKELTVAKVQVCFRNTFLQNASCNVFLCVTCRLIYLSKTLWRKEKTEAKHSQLGYVKERLIHEIGRL